MTAPIFDGSFAHNWAAEILPGRPMILPSRHFTYPREVEEVERGALEVLVQPTPGRLEPGDGDPQTTRFLATCALGFRDPATPTGIWSCPHPDWLCAVSGGYAYLIDTAQPERFTMLRYRPVLSVQCYLPEASPGSLPGLLLFAGHHSILAWGRDGEAWESERLSWEGVTVSEIRNGVLFGRGWDLITDRELSFGLDLASGRRIL